MKKEIHQMMALLTSLSLNGEKHIKKRNIRESTFRNYFKYWFIFEYLKERDDEEDLLWQKKNEVLPEIDIIDRMIDSLRESIIKGYEANAYLNEERAVELNFRECDESKWFPTNPLYIDNFELANEERAKDQFSYIFEHIDTLLLEVTSKDLNMQLQFIDWIKDYFLLEQKNRGSKLKEILPIYYKWIQEKELKLEAEKRKMSGSNAICESLEKDCEVNNVDLFERCFGDLNNEKYIDKNEYKKLKLVLNNYFNDKGIDGTEIRINKGSKGKFAYRLDFLYSKKKDYNPTEYFNYLLFLKSKINLFKNEKIEFDRFHQSNLYRMMKDKKYSSS